MNYIFRTNFILFFPVALFYSSGTECADFLKSFEAIIGAERINEYLPIVNNTPWPARSGLRTSVVWNFLLTDFEHA
jgi:hypothetical protein